LGRQKDAVRTHGATGAGAGNPQPDNTLPNPNPQFPSQHAQADPVVPPAIRRRETTDPPPTAKWRREEIGKVCSGLEVRRDAEGARPPQNAWETAGRAQPAPPQMIPVVRRQRDGPTGGTADRSHPATTMPTASRDRRGGLRRHDLCGLDNNNPRTFSSRDKPG